MSRSDAGIKKFVGGNDFHDEISYGLFNRNYIEISNRSKLLVLDLSESCLCKNGNKNEESASVTARRKLNQLERVYLISVLIHYQISSDERISYLE